jgi:uncharacterized membrane protein YhaH (DUF805 family)
LNIEVEGGLSIVLQSFAVIVVIGIIIPTYTVTIRRLHDLNLSGWWILIAVAGLLFILWIMFCREGTKGDNRFGSDPQYRT